MNAIDPSNINLNLQKIHQRIQGIKLVVVSKGHSIAAIEAAYHAGENRFGENYVKEAIAKQEVLSSLLIEWHFIGRIQSNKAALIADHFDWVQTVSSERQALLLNQFRSEEKTALNILIQINIDNDPQKGGVLPDDAEALIATMIKYPRLQLRGLMILPHEREAADQAVIFQQAYILFEKLKKSYPEMDTLSMGMSNDYEQAILAGATMIRLGSAILGLRER